MAANVPEGVHRVFFHELGHFVAREINAKYFGVSATKEISLIPYEEVEWLYKGIISPIIPEGQENIRHVIHVPEQIVDLTYGCFFECLYLKIPVKECFASNGSGQSDLEQWNGTLSAEGILGGNGQRGAIIKSEEEYFKQLIESNFFEKIRDLTIADYLIPMQGEKGKYLVNIDKLRRDLKSFIEEHEKLYVPYLEKMRRLIETAKI